MIPSLFSVGEPNFGWADIVVPLGFDVEAMGGFPIGADSKPFDVVELFASLRRVLGGEVGDEIVIAIVPLDDEVNFIDVFHYSSSSISRL